MRRKVLLIITLAAIAVIAVFSLSLNKKKSFDLAQDVPVRENVILPAEASGLTSIDSPDGKLTLLVKTLKSKSEVTYTFTVSGKEIFVKIVDPSTTISTPYNTWSPNGKYIFLKEEGPGGIKFFALSTTTASTDQNDQTANITDLFVKKYPDLTIEDATGWGGVNLVVFNSLKRDGSRGLSFWFEMPSHSIIQLSTHF